MTDEALGRPSLPDRGGGGVQIRGGVAATASGSRGGVVGRVGTALGVAGLAFAAVVFAAFVLAAVVLPVVVLAVVVLAAVVFAAVDFAAGVLAAVVLAGAVLSAAARAAVDLAVADVVVAGLAGARFAAVAITAAAFAGVATFVRRGRAGAAAVVDAGGRVAFDLAVRPAVGRSPPGSSILRSSARGAPRAVG